MKQIRGQRRMTFSAIYTRPDEILLEKVRAVMETEKISFEAGCHTPTWWFP